MERCSSSPVISIEDVSIVRNGQYLLRDIGWQVLPGDRWVIVGPNGAGKTTLLRVAGMQVLPTTGSIEVLGEVFGKTDARVLRQRIAFVSQSLLRAIRPSLSAHDVVLTGRFSALEPYWHRYENSDHDRAEELLARSGMTHVSQRPFGVLSEGERQHVLLNRALMSDPSLLLMDEPAAGLDMGAREHLITRLSQVTDDPNAPPLVMITHHVEEIPPAMTHALLLKDGCVFAAGEIDSTISSDHLSLCFGLELDVRCDGGRFSVRASS